MANSKRPRNLPTYPSYVTQLYRSVYTSEESKPLPSSWNTKDRLLSVKLSQSALTISCTADAPASRHNPVLELPTVRADHPIPLNAGLYYFETAIASFKPNYTILIGVASKRASNFSGWDSSSFGLHSDGSLYHYTSSNQFGPQFAKKDVIGCGVDLINKSLFFTRNGEFLGKAFEGKLPVSNVPDLYPVIALDGQGCRITTNFGDRPFVYPFKRHITEERESQENRLIGSLSADFINVRMQNLVAGYLVHHGYIDSARAFSRWTNLRESGSSALKTRNDLAMEGTEGGAEDAVEEKGEHKDRESITLGFASMQHRRSLRDLCHRCQYGRVANTLGTLYPSIVERHPELILQLRCRQLVEMMYRHSEQRSGQPLCTSDFKPQRTMRGSRKRPCTANASAYCLASESVSTLANCDDDQLVSKYLHTDSLHDAFKQSYFPTSVALAAASCDAMDIDSGLKLEAHVNHFPHPRFCLVDQASCGVPAGIPSFANLLSTPRLLVSVTKTRQQPSSELFDEDDGGFELTGSVKQQRGSTKPFPMDTESVPIDSAPMPAFTTSPPKAPLLQSFSSREDSIEEENRLLRQIQFSRSVTDLAKYVKEKCGSLSAGTERLLKQSVSLMAYPSPSSPECPLRCLLDPSWRDNIASLINSAILTEAHHLPPQPAIEQALYALQKCFANPEFQEAQVLGHFLLYHLSPSKYTTEIQIQRSTSSPVPSLTLSAFHSSQYPRGQQEAALLTNNNNSASNASHSNGCGGPQKRHLYTPPSSNGTCRRRWRQRHASSVNSTLRSGIRYAPVETLASTDEDEVGGISIEEGVQLYHHAELEDDEEEDVESLDEEAEVELMTATMEEDEFGEDIELNLEEDNDSDEDEEEEDMAEDEVLSEGDEEEEIDDEVLPRQGPTFNITFAEGRDFRRSSARGGNNSSSSSIIDGSRSLASISTSSPGYRGDSLSAYAPDVSRLSGIRARRFSHLLVGNTSGGVRGPPPSRSSRRSGHASNRCPFAGNHNNNQ